MPQIFVRMLVLAGLLIGGLGACSMKSAIEAMSSPEDRAFAQAAVQNLRTGNRAWLVARTLPEHRDELAAQLPQMPALFPRDEGVTTLVGFSFHTNRVVGGEEMRAKEYVLVTEGRGASAVTRIATLGEGSGPDRITGWLVTPHQGRAPEIAAYENANAAAPWILGILLVIVLGVIALIVFLVRRSRRRQTFSG